MKDYVEHYIQHCPNCREYVGEDSISNEECYECYAPLSKEQRNYAFKNPDLYGKEVLLPNSQASTVIQQAEYLRIHGEIKAVFGVFAVTDRGIECLSHDYFIERIQICKEDWIQHMKDKNWVLIEDFKHALEYVKSHLSYI